MGTSVSKTFFLIIFCFMQWAFANDDEAKALERLTMTTDMLVSIGEEMVGQPQGGILLLGDTISIDLNLLPNSSYQFVVWTNSAFNYVDFWLTNPQGEIPTGSIGDHITLAVIPDSLEVGIWQLKMELIEGADSDTAYYATATFRRSRILQ